MFKKFIKKFGRQSKPKQIAYILFGVIYLVGLVLFVKSLLSLTGIETVIRIIVIILLILYALVYIFVGIILMFTGRNKGFIALIVLAGLLCPIMFIGSYYIDKTYNILDNVQKKYATYTSVMISLNDTEEYNTVGMISSEDDPTGYILPLLMIEEENITAEIVMYDDYVSMMSDLYDGIIDALFTSDAYETMFNTYEKFENIGSEVKVVYTYTKELENVDNVSYSTKDLTEPFTILLMGVDSTSGSIASSSSFNGDTLMLITFNPNTLSATIFSIPRDTYVPIACNNDKENKINSSAYGGTSCVVNTIQNLTGIDIDYYVKINFNGLITLVNDLGGITVDVPMTFCESDSQRRTSSSYQICLEEGVQELNGEQALALARHRHSLPLGDFQRIQNQQLIVEAMLESAKNISSTSEFYTILNDVANNIDTNMTTDQILSLYEVGKNILLNSLGDSTSLSIQKTYLTGYDLTIYMQNTKSYVYTFQYYKQSLEEIVTAMKINLGLIEPTLVKTFSFDAEEEYETYVVGKTYYSETRRELLPDFTGTTKSYVESWAEERGITVNFTEQESTSVQSGIVLSQTEHKGRLVSEVSTLNITIAKYTSSSSSTTNDSDEEEEDDEVLPNFIGMSIDEFNTWKNSLSNVNIVINKEVLTIDDIITLEISDPEENIIYKQSVSAGTDLKDITSLTVYYYE